MPSTTAASRALASGTASDCRPLSRAARAAESAPRTGRTLPSSESSPRNIILLTDFPKNWPMQPARPRAMGRSKAEPSFLTSAGARLMVTPCPVGKFEAAIAQCGFDSFPAFFDGVVRQTDYIEVLHVGGTDVHFDFDELGIDAKHSGAERF